MQKGSQRGEVDNYFMLNVLIPQGVCNEIERIARKFIWGLWNEERKASLVKWETCCKPWRNCGFGLRRLKEHNESFLLKLAF